MPTQNEYVIITWNIRGSSSLGWNIKNESINKAIVDKFIEQDAHIIVLTEFVVISGIDYLFEQLQSHGYIWFFNSQTGKNGILIAIRKELVDEKEIRNQIYKNNIIASNFEGCNILKVKLPLQCRKILYVIGCRMETRLSENLKENYDMESENFKKVLAPNIKAVEEGDLCIVCGDFNNAQCRGDLNEQFNPDNYNDLSQQNYNLNILKDYFTDLKYVMADIENGSPLPTFKYVPNDHIFVHGFDINECKTIPVGGLSDHKLLFAKIIPQEA